MATEPLTARAHAWATALNTYTELNQKLDLAQPGQRDALERSIAQQEQLLLDMPAPDFSAVVSKLEMMWEAHLHGLDQSSEEKRLILEDLGDLIAETHQLLGAAA